MGYTKHEIDDNPENITRAIDSINCFKAYRNRDILKCRYVQRHTYEEVAEIFEMSPRQIKKICYDYESKIIDKLRVEE